MSTFFSLVFTDSLSGSRDGSVVFKSAGNVVGEGGANGGGIGGGGGCCASEIANCCLTFSMASGVVGTFNAFMMFCIAGI